MEFSVLASSSFVKFGDEEESDQEGDDEPADERQQIPDFEDDTGEKQQQANLNQTSGKLLHQ